MLPKAALLNELYERERSLARQRSELAAGERAAPMTNTELFVVAAESLRVQAASKACARLEGFGGERLDEARARAAQGKIAGARTCAPPLATHPLSHVHTPHSFVCACLPSSSGRGQRPDPPGVRQRHLRRLAAVVAVFERGRDEGESRDRAHVTAFSITHAHQHHTSVCNLFVR